MLVQLEACLGAIQTRVTLVTAIERRRRSGAGPGFEPLLGQLRAENRDAFAAFREMTLRRGALRPAAPRVPRLSHRPAHPTPSRAPGRDDERWERMAQWLLGKGRGSG
jgi:hypothetical protein